MLQVQKIACSNAAGFVMNFAIKYLQDDGSWGSAGESGNYPIDQTRTIDGNGQGIPEGTPMTPEVHAILGVTHDGTPLVAFAPNGQTATYNVHGTTLNYSVDLNR
ncbi:MAG TPA: hypothetical protein VFW96_12335 [Thermomicrobiales bacterium]|nr:hypothetical protein [Thermomicrobiales bacterium]